MGEHNCCTSDLKACIEKKARELWEKDGCKPGLDQDYWLKAEKCINSGAKKTPTKK